MQNQIIAAADGSALGNPGPAGWAWYIDENHWAAGGWEHGTNNMGEIKAVLDLFEATAHRAESKLLIYCDSQYVINSLTQWMPGWKKRGWKKADGKPVQNRDLLEALDAASTGRPSKRGENPKPARAFPVRRIQQVNRAPRAPKPPKLVKPRTMLTPKTPILSLRMRT